MAERSGDLITRMLAALLVLTLIGAGVSLLGSRSARADLDQRDRWATKLAEVDAALNPAGGRVDEGALDRALHTLEIILPEVEAEEASDLVTVRDAMEASLKVRNRSLADSLRPQERDEGIVELREGMGRLMPQLTDDHQRVQAALATKSLIAMISGAMFVFAAIGCAVRWFVVRSR